MKNSQKWAVRIARGEQKGEKKGEKRGTGRERSHHKMSKDGKSYFTEEDIQIASKHGGDVQQPEPLGQCDEESPCTYYDWLTAAPRGWGAESLREPHTAGGNVACCDGWLTAVSEEAGSPRCGWNMQQSLRKTAEPVSYKLKLQLPHHPAVALLDMNEMSHSHKNTYLPAHSLSIQDREPRSGLPVGRELKCSTPISGETPQQ